MAMKKIESFLKKLEKLPVSDLCPLIQNKAWKNCGKFDKGNEPHCKTVSGYVNCPHFQKWFYWNVSRMLAMEMARLKAIKKKEAKKK
jgi:hypothetical protein